MTGHMTTIEGVPDSSDAIPGMAYFTRTGPPGKTCGDCKLRGYYRATQDGSLTYRVNKCAMFKKLSGHHGQDISAKYLACKYFEAKPK